MNIFGVDDRIQLAETGLGVYVVNLGLAAVAIFGFLDQRKEKLQALRTSKRGAARSTPAKGEVACYERLLQLLPSITPESCEALTLIKYDPGDALAPHYDANRAADAEDVARGGQTLATLLVYLNDVDDGGCTRFNKLDITVAPRKGGSVPLLPRGRVGAVRRAARARGRSSSRREVDGAHLGPCAAHHRRDGRPPGTLERAGDRWSADS